jgi:hypothetical protein
MSDPKESPIQDQQDITKTAKPIRCIVPPGVLNHFSNYAMVQFDGEQGIFTLSFYEIQNPPLMGTIEEKRATLEAITSIPAVCMARIILTPSHFEKLISVMQTSFEGARDIVKGVHP